MNSFFKKLSGGWWFLIAIIFVIILILVGRSTSTSPTSPSKTNREVALSCTVDMATQFHIHPNLEIIINGVKQTIPANIGITALCMHPLHTHDASGMIHVESPVQRDFTLDDFFVVWEKTFNKDVILDSHVDNDHVIKMTVNGTTVDTYENTVLRDADRIVISFEGKNENI